MYQNDQMFGAVRVQLLKGVYCQKTENHKLILDDRSTTREVRFQVSVEGSIMNFCTMLTHTKPSNPNFTEVCRLVVTNLRRKSAHALRPDQCFTD